MLRSQNPSLISWQQHCRALALGGLCMAAFSVGISVTATTVFFLFAFLCALLSGRWWAGFTALRHNPGLLSFWLLFALYVFGMFYTISPQHTAWRDLLKMHWMLMTPFFACLFTEEHWRRRLLNAFLLAMSLTLALSYLKAAGLALPSSISHVSANNVFFEHIVQTFFFNVAAFIAAYRGCFERSSRALYFTLAGFFTLNIAFFSESATGFVTFAVFLAILFARRFGWKGIMLAGALAVFVMALACYFSPLVQQRWQRTQLEYHQYQAGQTITTVGLRLAMWENATHLLKYEPWFGFGTGGIKAAMQQHLSPTEISRTGLIDYVEITPLNFMLEFGIPGLVIFMLFLWWQFKTIIALTDPFRTLMLGFFLAYLAASTFNCFFISVCETHLYALLAAISFSTLPLPRKVPSQALRSSLASA